MDKIVQEERGSFLPGAKIDRHGLRIPEHFSDSKKLMFKCLVHTLSIEILSYLLSKIRSNKNEQDHLY